MARHPGRISTFLSLAFFTVLAAGCARVPLAAPSASVRAPGTPATVDVTHPPSHAPRLEPYGRLPLHFEENRGQAATGIEFLARTEHGAILLTPSGLVLPTDLGPIGLTFAAGSRSPRLEPLHPLPGRVNDYRGRDRSRWRTGIGTYGQVRYEAIYPGIDVVVYGTQRQLEYDFVVAPGADPRAIRLRIDGADHVELDAEGRLVIGRGEHTIVQSPPVIYQQRGGRREPVAGRYVLGHGHEVVFEVGAYDRSRALVIDPVIAFSTRVGGGSATAIAVDGAGYVYITGENGGASFGSDYPLLNPAFPHRSNGFKDIFVTKLTPGGDALVFSTFIGSHGHDFAHGIALDRAGNVWIAGQAGQEAVSNGSGDFPTTPDAVMPTWTGGGDAVAGVVAKFSPTGSLLYSTYLAGNSVGAGGLPGGACEVSAAHGVAVDPADNAYVVGFTRHVDFPTTPGAYQTARAAGPAADYCHGDSAAFVTKLTSAGALAYSTYLDGAGRPDSAAAVSVDAAGNAYVAGVTGSGGSAPFPITTTLAPSGAQTGGYVVKLNATGFPAQATIVGPTPEAIALGPDGSVYIGGRVQGTDFTAVNAFQAAAAGGAEGFAARLNAAGTAYVWSTYVGGSGDDVIGGLAVDGSGSAWLAGSTTSANFPTKDAIRARAAATEAVALKLSASGQLLFGTYLGDGHGNAVAVGPGGAAYVTGDAAVDFPTTPGAYKTTPTGTQNDVFVLKLADSSGTGRQPVVWTSPVKVAVDGNTITKNAGCNGCSDAGAVSQQTIASGDGAVEFTVSVNAYLTVGLSTGNPGTTANEIKFGLRFYPGNVVEVREGGAYKTDWTYAPGATHKIAVAAGVVKYSLNGVLKYTSTQVPTYPLLVDTAVWTLGAGVQNATITTAGGGGGLDTTPPTVTITAPAGGTTVSGTATVSATATDDVGVASVQLKVDGANVGSADSTSPYSITWDTTTATNGAHTLTAVATDAAGNTTTSAPVTVTVSNSGPGPGPGPQPVVWTSAVNATVSGNTVTKSGGCDGCFDAGAVSQQSINTGTGSVEFTTPANAFLVAGLSNGNPGTSGNEIDFGLRFYPGSPGIVEVRESGAYKWDWLNAAGAVHRIAVEAGVVKYYQNGVLKYTSATAPSLPLLVDTALGSSGSAVQNAVIGP